VVQAPPAVSSCQRLVFGPKTAQSGRTSAASGGWSFKGTPSKAKRESKGLLLPGYKKGGNWELGSLDTTGLALGSCPLKRRAHCSLPS